MPPQAHRPTRTASAAPEAAQGALRAIGYVRVSTEEQGTSGAGLAAQRRAIRSACADRGFELVDLFEDVASAKDLKRPQLKACLSLLAAGEADALVVARLDRLSRSLLDFSGLLQQSQKKGWKLVALDLAMDTSTAVGEMCANVLLTMAQFERKLGGQRTKEALAARKAEGVKIGRPRMLSDDLVSRIVSDHQGGMSLGAIARALNKEAVPTAHGGAMWHPSTVKRVLESEAAN